MQGLDWLILGIYFAVLIAIGIWASSKASHRFLHVGH